MILRSFSAASLSYSLMKYGGKACLLSLLNYYIMPSTTANLPRQKPTAGCPPWRRDRRHLGISEQRTVERFAVVLSRLRELDHVIAPKEGFEAQLQASCLPITLRMRALGLIRQIRDGRLQRGREPRH